MYVREDVASSRARPRRHIDYGSQIRCRYVITEAHSYVSGQAWPPLSAPSLWQQAQWATFSSSVPIAPTSLLSQQCLLVFVWSPMEQFISMHRTTTPRARHGLLRHPAEVIEAQPLETWVIDEFAQRRARAVVNTSAAPRPVTKMSRAALMCCTALTLILSAGVAHAQQGNLPRPVQKLPAYPPVVCVTPNWRSEPCEGRHDIPQVMEEDRAQPALPLLNSRNTPRAFECIKPAEPGWLGLGGLFQLRDRTWFGWIEPYPVKPFDGKWPASQLAEPVKCLKPDGREEPCESGDTAQPLTPRRAI